MELFHKVYCDDYENAKSEIIKEMQEIFDIAIEQGLRFAIHEGGRIVG